MNLRAGLVLAFIALWPIKSKTIFHLIITHYWETLTRPNDYIP